MRKSTLLLGALSVGVLASTAAYGGCDAGSLGLNFGKEKFESHTKVDVPLDGGVTINQAVDRNSSLNVVGVSGTVPLGCATLNPTDTSVGAVGVVEVGQAKGSINSILDSSKSSDVTSTFVSAGPEVCVFFPTKTNLCAGALVRSEVVKWGDWSSTVGGISPLVAIEQGVGSFKFKVEANLLGTETKINSSLQDFSQTGYTVGLAYVFN